MKKQRVEKLKEEFWEKFVVRDGIISHVLDDEWQIWNWIESKLSNQGDKIKEFTELGDALQRKKYSSVEEDSRLSV